MLKRVLRRLWLVVVVVIVLVVVLFVLNTAGSHSPNTQDGTCQDGGFFGNC